MLGNLGQAALFYAKSKQLLLELVDCYPAYAEFRKTWAG